MSGHVIARGARSLSPRVTTLYAVLAAAGFSATSGAPTPLYHHYQPVMGLSAAMISVIFEAYAIAMLAAFLTVARLPTTWADGR